MKLFEKLEEKIAENSYLNAASAAIEAGYQGIKDKMSSLDINIDHKGFRVSFDKNNRYRPLINLGLTAVAALCTLVFTVVGAGIPAVAALAATGFFGYQTYQEHKDIAQTMGKAFKKEFINRAEMNQSEQPAKSQSQHKEGHNFNNPYAKTGFVEACLNKAKTTLENVFNR